MSNCDKCKKEIIDALKKISEGKRKLEKIVTK